MTSAFEKKDTADNPTVKPTDRSETKPKAKGKKEDRPWELFFYTSVSLAVLCLALFGWSVSSVPLLLVELLVGFAATCSGGLLGFLFGLPRASVRDDGEKKQGYVPNTNLETISDWLTKILIGVGLVQLREIGTLLDSIVGITLESVGQPPPFGTEIVTYAVIITFLMLGFLFGFLWTRIIYTRLQTETDDSLVRLLQRVNNLDQKVEEQKSATENLESDVSKQKDVTEKIVTGDISSGKLQASEESKANVEELGSAAAIDEPIPLPKDIADRLERFKNAPSNWKSDPAAEIFNKAKKEDNGRKLEAIILSEFSSSLLINLRVVETDSKRPLKGPVMFLLHPTFSNRLQYAQPHDGVADITIRPGGWFTVVAITEEDPATVLSLDLRDIPGVPRWFKQA